MVKKYGWKFLILGGIGKLISLTLVFGIYGHWFGDLLDKEEESMTIHLTSDMSPDDMLAEVNLAVTDAGGDGDKIARTIWARGWTDKLKPGKYLLGGDLSIGEAARQLIIGKRAEVKVVVPSCRDIEVVAENISKSISSTSEEILILISPDSIRWQIIPNTYFMYQETDAEGAVERILTESEKWWNEDRLAQAKSKGLNPEEAVILASIVQAETKHLPEAPTVAGLYINRLKKGMLLQADPTLKYALQDTTIRRFLDVDKAIDSPYNTYLHTGLPPGTINVPEPTFIDAVLNAEAHDYIFMCAKPNISGEHNFAVRYNDHLKNANKYHNWLNKQGIYR